MNRREAEDFVYKSYLKAQKLQDYHAKDATKRNPDLTREMIRKRTGTPCVVVTGSKGKGSAANMISQILQSEYTVGLMTSPHISDFCERFKVNGQNMPADDFAAQMNSLRPEFEAIEAVIPEDWCISPMGIQAVLGLNYFGLMQTDFNVFECGKGAKYDDVNNIKHDYAVINSIFLEHTRELGATIEEIAADKAHVITGEQKCVYVAEQKPEVMKVLEERAKRLHVPLKCYGKDFYADKIRYMVNGMVFDVIVGTVRYSDICIPLLGEHQAKNCAMAFCLCRDVLPNFDLDVAKKKLYELNWPGRMEVQSGEPFMLLDACINGESCRNVKQVLKYLNISNLTLIVGIPDDKDYLGVVKNMRSLAGKIILTKSGNPHYRFTIEQKECLEKQGISVIWTDSVKEAIEQALQFGQPIVILGTTSVVAEVKTYKKQ